MLKVKIFTAMLVAMILFDVQCENSYYALIDETVIHVYLYYCQRKKAQLFPLTSIYT